MDNKGLEMRDESGYAQNNSHGSKQEQSITVKPSKKTRIAIGVAVVCGLAALGLLIGVIVLATKEDEEPATVAPSTVAPPPDICMTSDCVSAAARLTEYMDMTVDPCDDFYTYACGTWRRKNPIPEELSGYSTFRVLRDEVEVILKEVLEKEATGQAAAITKAKTLYSSCVDTDVIEALGTQPLQDLLTDVGPWPILQTNWAGPLDLTAQLLKVRKYQSGPLLYQGVGTDLKDSNSRILQLDQPSLGLPSRDYFNHTQAHGSKYTDAYKALITGVAELLGAPVANLPGDVDALLAFEIQLAAIITPQEDRRDTEALYNKFSIANLSLTFDTADYQFPWLRYMQGIMNDPDVGFAIDGTEPVVLYAPEYITKLMDLLFSTQDRTLANYIVWRGIKGRMFSLPTAFRDLEVTYAGVIYGTLAARARWRDCASYTVSYLPKAVGRLFVQEAFDEDAKAIALEMIHGLHAAFDELVSVLAWMDEQTITAAKEKAAAITQQIGYPDEILDDAYLNLEYVNYNYIAGTFFANGLMNLQQDNIETLKKLRETIDKMEWTTAPSTVNAFYSSVRNQIVFPGGILQPPFFSKYYPKSMNYGAIGVVIGHEITHGFDDRGREFDKDGNLQQWWTDASIASFVEKAQCIIDQYGQYFLEEANMNLNGFQTQGENIADNGGLKQSYKAYRDWVSLQGKEEPLLPGVNLTHNQLFFVSFAQVWCNNIRPQGAVNSILTGVHSPGQFRVLGTLHNSQDFSTAFNCPHDASMNPHDKCSVW